MALAHCAATSADGGEDDARLLRRAHALAAGAERVLWHTRRPRWCRPRSARWWRVRRLWSIRVRSMGGARASDSD